MQNLRNQHSKELVEGHSSPGRIHSFQTFSDALLDIFTQKKAKSIEDVKKRIRVLSPGDGQKRPGKVK